VTIPLSQAHTETINSILKKCIGTSRHSSDAHTVANEMAVRLLGPPQEECEPIIHRAVHEWSMAAQRRLLASRGDSDSSDSGGSTTHGDTSSSSSSLSVSGSSSSLSSTSSDSLDTLDTCSEDSKESHEDGMIAEVPQPEEEIESGVQEMEEPVQQANMDVDAKEVDFLTQLGNMKPRLTKFIGMLRRNGYDELDALKYISVRELADMDMSLGDRAVLRSAMEFFLGGTWTPTP
jgi:hypothetical protein